MADTPLIVGFSKKDKKRIDTHLKKLIPHLVKDNFVIVGGIAIRYHLIKAGLKYPKRPFNDLDLIAKNSSDVLTSVTKDFLISHYHPQKGGNFYIVLVDPDTKTKVDIFCYIPRPEKAETVFFHNYPLKLISLEDQLIKTIQDTLKVLDNIIVDPKQFQDANLMLKIADAEFTQKNQKCIESFKKAEEKIKKYPELIKEKPFIKSAPYDCPDCMDTKDYPLTSKKKIFEVLGYIE